MFLKRVESNSDELILLIVDKFRQLLRRASFTQLLNYQ